jgi:hypothetical protein
MTRLAAAVAVALALGCDVEASLGAHDGGADAPACPALGDAGACAACAASICCADFTACAAAPHCPCIADCVLHGSLVADCETHCGASDVGGLAAALAACAHVSCASACH